MRAAQAPARAGERRAVRARAATSGRGGVPERTVVLFSERTKGAFDMADLRSAACAVQQGFEGGPRALRGLGVGEQPAEVVAAEHERVGVEGELFGVEAGLEVALLDGDAGGEGDVVEPVALGL